MLNLNSSYPGIKNLSNKNQENIIRKNSQARMIGIFPDHPIRRTTLVCNAAILLREK